MHNREHPSVSGTENVAILRQASCEKKKKLLNGFAENRKILNFILKLLLLVKVYSSIVIE